MRPKIKCRKLNGIWVVLYPPFGFMAAQERVECATGDLALAEIRLWLAKRSHEKSANSVNLERAGNWRWWEPDYRSNVSL